MSEDQPLRFDIEPETQNLLDEVTAAISLLDERRPFSPEIRQRITSEFLPDRVTATLNMEGISVTRRQTLLLMDAMTLTENSTKAEQEIKNALDADEFVYEMATEGHPLSERMVREINRLMQREIIDTPGEYRKKEVEITGAQFQPPAPAEVGPQMYAMIERYNATSGVHPILKAIWIHATFTHIHPFVDGNGRTGRLLQDYTLLAANHYPTGIPSAKRDDYYAALEKADEGKWDQLAQLVARLQLDVVARIQAIADEAVNRGQFVKVLAQRASHARSGALHKQYVVWRQRMQTFLGQLVETCESLNKESEVLHIESELFPIIDFEKWKQISEEGWASNSWALKQNWYSEGQAFYRTIMYFKRHYFRRDDTYSKDDLYGLVSLRITGGQPEYGARFDFDFFADQHLRLRQILYLDGKMAVFSSDGLTPSASRSDQENWVCEDDLAASDVINTLLEDIFVRKLGI